MQQYHQNGGGTVNGHYLGWGDQNYDVLADHLGAQTQDASQATTATLGGTITTGDQIGWQIGSAHTYITVASGDTSTTLSNELAAALQGGAISATVAAGAGGGYSNNDVVTLNGVSASCPTAPAFELTVAGGNVTAAAVTGSGGSGIIGGYCTATPTGPFAVTGGSGSGLTLNVSFASPAIAQAMLAVTDANRDRLCRDGASPRVDAAIRLPLRRDAPDLRQRRHRQRLPGLTDRDDRRDDRQSRQRPLWLSGAPRAGPHSGIERCDRGMARHRPIERDERNSTRNMAASKCGSARHPRRRGW